MMRMLEMPLAQLEDNVHAEIDNNPSIEADQPDYDASDYEPTDTARSDEEERRDDALQDALEQIGRDDRMDDYSDSYVAQRQAGNDDDAHTFDDGNITSFSDTLLEQMRTDDLDEQQMQIMEYLIGSLDDDGLLRKDLDVINDELAIYSSIFVERQQIEHVLHRLQKYEPAGIGAQSLKQCLLIQTERLRATPVTMMMYQVIDQCYDDFVNNHWDNICKQLSINEAMAEDIRHEIKKRLNPKPGAAYGEAEGRSMQQITPDFIVTINYDGSISLELNNGRVPALHVVKEDEDFLATMANNTSKSKAQKDAMLFIQNNVSRARNYIDALRQRNITMTRTMKAIIDLQRPYFLSGDDADLKPMVLKDVAEKTGYDLSTISRVSRAKYVQTPWGIFRLRHFFNEAYTTHTGETMSTREIKQALKDVIAAEDPKKPLSDEKLVTVMTQRGYPIARRTIAKYREQLNIPVARLRKS